jgi:hypothetical protein
VPMEYDRIEAQYDKDALGREVFKYYEGTKNNETFMFDKLPVEP